MSRRRDRHAKVASWITRYNEVHPHKALGYRSPASSSQIAQVPDRGRSFGGYKGLRFLLVADAQKAPLVLVVCGDPKVEHK